MLYHKLIEERLNDKRVVLSDGQTEMTFRQIHEKTAQYCAVFQEMKLKKGERIVTVTNDLINTVIIFLACIAKGLIFVPINENLDEDNKKRIIRDCSPVLILEDFQQNICKKKIKNRCFDMEKRKLCTEDTLVYILYTSGSEGIPRGVAASQKQIFFCSREINSRLGNTKADRILCCLPLSFDYGLYQIFLSFFSGAVLYLDSGAVIQRIPYLLEKWKITAFPTIPSVANILVKFNMLRGNYNCLRYITFTGEILPVSLLEKLKEICSRTRMVPMYGLTECKRVSVMPENREDKIKAGSCGLPLDGVRVYLDGQDIESGIGELVVSGRNVMEGYWGIRDSELGVFDSDEKTGERVVRTGDLFKVDEEGFLYFCGRKSGIIKIWGHRTSSAWIENQLNGAKGVLETAVTSIPDADAGERLVIFVYAERKDAKKFVRDKMRKLPTYFQDYELYILQEPLPKNLNGKTDIKKLWKMKEN